MAIGLAVLGIAATGLTRITTPPRRGEPTGLIFAPFTDPRADLAALLADNPRIDVLNVALGGYLVYVIARDGDIARDFRSSGVVHAFSATAGCGGIARSPPL